MKPVIVIFTLASAIVAQDLGDLPPCAKNCLAEFTTGNQIGNCARLDAKCICGSDTFINGIACCLAGVCNASDQQQAVNFARTFCATQGITDLPQSVTCASASTSGTSTSGASTSPTTPASSSSSSSTTAPAATVTPNAALPAGMASKANLCGGLLAALAML